MMKPVSGQYECVHRSGVGLDYFTSRVDRLTLQPNGRFVLIVQERSRIAQAADSLASGQQPSMAAKEVQREGSYVVQGALISFSFDDGQQLQGQLAPNGDGLSIGQNAFNKVSDSTFLPPTQRIQKDMDDIAKGLKIAGTIGGIAIKAAKTIHETIQSTQSSGTAGSQAGQVGQAPGSQRQPPVQPSAPPPSYPPYGSGQPAQPVSPAPQPSSPPYQAPQPVQPAGQVETLYCDQCGARVRPGKRFCNTCGARLP